MHREYETVIGLEVHVELATHTKIFCGCSTQFGSKPNANTCPVCTGMPGSLPMLNKKVLEHAVAVGLATNCKITRYCKFDRKNYFYPDNPQNYQISQLYLPICRDGFVEVDLRGRASSNPAEDRTGTKKIRIHEIHMEEDAGKLIHNEESGETLVDYNRSGVPLIEIVTDPDMRSSEEVIAFLEELRLIIQYLGASDCKIQEGSMRVDVNLSVRPVGESTLGTRTEMKNLGSFTAIQKAIANESQRQMTLLESGYKVEQETRRWDEAKECSYSMRSKEDSKDYRYFPDPDLVPIDLDDTFLNRICSAQPELPRAKRERYLREFGIPQYDIGILTGTKALTDIFEETVELGAGPKKVSNWLMGETLRILKEEEREPETICFSPENLAQLIALTECGAINSTVAKEVFEVMFHDNVEPKQYVEEHGLTMVSDETALRKVVEQVILENPKSVQDFQSGKERALGFLVGQAMKATKGKTNPQTVKELLKEILPPVDRA